MFQIWQGLLVDLGIVTLFTVLWIFIEETAAAWRPVRRAALVGLFMGVGAICLMLLPVDFGDGIRIDARSSFLVVSAFFGGPVSALIAGAIAISYRILSGGLGTFAGCLNMGIAIAIGLAAQALLKEKVTGRLHVLMLSGAAGCGSFLGFLGLPRELWAPVFGPAGIPLATVTFAATLISGLMITQDIRRRELAKTNQIYRSIIDALPDCLNVKDLEGRFIAANPATAALMQSTNAENLIGKTDFDFYPEATARAFRADELRALEIGQPQILEQEATHADGSKSWLWTLKAPLRDANGRVIGLITHNRDINEWKRLSRDLALSQRQFAEATANMADGLVIFDHSARIVFCNEQYRSMFPRTADMRVPGMSLRDILIAAAERGESVPLPGEEIETWADSRASQIAQEGEYTIELAKDRWIHARTCATPDGGFLMTLSDVTDRRHFFEELRRAESRWNFALESARQGVWDHDARTGRTYYSKVWKDIIGYDEDEITDDPGVWLKLIHPDDRAAVEAADEAHLRGETAYFEAEFRMRHKDGHWVWIRDRGRVVEADTDGQALRAIGTHTDITLQREADQTIRASEERFRSLFELSPVGIALVDMASRRLIMQSRSLSTMLGLAPDACDGLILDDLIDTAKGPVPDLETEFKAGRQLGPLECDLAHRGGHTVPAIITGAPVAEQDNGTEILLVFQDISARRNYEQQLQTLANQDPLTGLPNRLQFSRRLAEIIASAQRASEKMAVALFDLDHFKDVNDTYGHDAGDELLRQIAARTASALRSTDVLARLGGDEFVIAFSGITDPLQLARPLDGVIDAVMQPILIGGVPRRFSISIGVALYPDDGLDGTSLLKQADTALYRAKDAGRGRYAFFKAEMHETAQQRIRCVREASEAFEAGGARLTYLPIVTANGAPIGLRARLVLDHAALGPLSPEQLATSLHDPGLARTLGLAAVSQAIADAGNWQRAGVAFGTITLDLNSQLARSDGLVENLVAMLDEAGLPASCFSLAIRETMLLDRGKDRMIKIIGDLHRAGVSLTLDQFGDGPSALTHLRTLPIDAIAIADSLVCDCPGNSDHAVVVIGLTALAHRLGLAVTAASGGSVEHFAFLKQAGVDRIVRDLDGTAMTFDRATAFLRGERRANTYLLSDHVA